MSLDLYLVHEVNLGGPDEPHRFKVWEGNLTYNLTPMLDAAGAAQWNRVGRTAGEIHCRADLILPDVQYLLAELQRDPGRYRAMEPANGWGTYDGAVEFLKDLERAITMAPLSTVDAWR